MTNIISSLSNCLVLHGQDGTGVYMVSSNNSVSMDGDRIDSNMSNATRVSPATVSA